MIEKCRISSWQVTAYIVSLILPTSILFIPSITSQSAGRDSWISLLIALAYGLLVAVIASKLSLRFPSETVIEYSPKILGNFLGKIVGFIYACYFYYVAYFVLRQFSTLMSIYMVKTPPWINITIITAISCYALYLGLEAICRANSIVIVLFLVTLSIIILLTSNNILLENFTPMLTTPIGGIVYGALAPAAWTGECAVILMLAPFLADRKKAMRATVYAALIVFFSMLVVTLGIIGIFSAEAVSRMLFPTFSLARITQLPAMPVFERLDALVMIIWVAGATFKVITFFYAGTLAFAQLFGLASYKTLIIPSGILLISLSLVSWDSLSDLLVFSSMVFPLSINFVNLILTSLLFLFSFRNIYRRKKGVIM